mgnify:CR=1 FL=1
MEQYRIRDFNKNKPTKHGSMDKQVDFYILSQPTFRNCFNFCAKLTSKVYREQGGCEISIDNQGITQELDQFLWEFKTEAFLPHHIDENHANNIIVASNSKNIDSILINCKPADQVHRQTWQRLLQIVPNNPDLLALARTQFRHYQQNNINVNTHKIG